MTCDAPLVIGAFVRDLARRHGDRELIVKQAAPGAPVDPQDDRLTYAEAEARSAIMARVLASRGVGKGSRVGVWLPNGPRFVVTWLAAARIGAVVVPINTFYQPRELGWILRHADVDHLVCQGEFLGHDHLARLEAASPGIAQAGAGPLRVTALPRLRSVSVHGDAGGRDWATDGALLEDAREIAPGVDAAFLESLESTVAAADPLTVLYSSGSTADPKGAVHTQGSVLRHAAWLAAQRDIHADDRVWSPMPFFWVGGFVFALVCNLHAGATTLCEDVFEPEATLRFLERERATVAIGWPHFGKALADHPTRKDRDLSALRGGNVPDILPDVPADPALRGTALGMTETCGPHTWGGDGVLPEELRGSFGTAVEGVEHKVVDPETGETLPPGRSGEICVRGRSLMQGLHKVAREDTFDADGYYHTGDGGFFDANGVLYFEARLGDMIKTGGANVTPAEVETVLAGYPEVKAAHVVGLPDADRGQVVAAAVVLEQGVEAEPDALRARIKGDLSAYKVPRHLWVLGDADLPFTDSGKIDKQRLAADLAARLG